MPAISLGAFPPVSGGGHLAAQDVLPSRIAEKIGLDPVPVVDVAAETAPDGTADC